MGSILQTMAAWIAGLAYDDIPERVVAKAKLQILSMLASVYAGYPTRAARQIREVALSSRAQGRALILPGGDRTSPTVAAMANAAASMALEFDDSLFMGHTGHSAVLASLALAQEEGACGKDWLRALIAANEVGGRLGASLMLGPQAGQLWTHIHAPAAACAGAVLLNLDETATAHAIALALAQPPPAAWPSLLGSDARLLSAANPARDGLQAARLAAWGLTGPAKILDSDRSQLYLPQMLTGWGQTWVTDSLSYKIHPGCAFIDTAVEAMLTIRDQFAAKQGRALALADVRDIEVRSTLLGAELHRISSRALPEKLAPCWISFSIPHALAVIIRAGRLTPAELDDKHLNEGHDEIMALASKIHVGHDWSLTLEMLEKMNQAMPLSRLIGEMDLRRLLAQKSEGGRELGGLVDLKPKDVLRLAGFLLNQAPRLVRRAGRAAKNGLGRLVSENEADFDLTQADFEQASMPFASTLELITQSGDSYQARVDIPPAAAGRDGAETRGLVRKKFRDQASRPLRPEQVDRALQLIDALEDLSDLEELGQALTA